MQSEVMEDADNQDGGEQGTPVRQSTWPPCQRQPRDEEVKEMQEDETQGQGSPQHQWCHNINNPRICPENPKPQHDRDKSRKSTN